jgi:deoxycytidine triphosphate deaminase
MKHLLSETSKSSLTNIKYGDVLPNSVMLRLSKVFKMAASTFKIDDNQTVYRGSYEIKPDPLGYFNLAEGSYEVVMSNEIVVGENEAGLIVTSVDLIRNGVFLTSSLYESEYEGLVAAVMHVTCGPMRIAKGTKIGQYVSFNSEVVKKYEGQYADGKKYDEQKMSQLQEMAKTQVVDVLKDIGIDVDEANIPTVEYKRGRGRPPGAKNKKDTTDVI